MNIDRLIYGILQNAGIPYAAVRVYKDHCCLYSLNYCATGREKLNMYSLTKPVTAVCGLKLVENGAISLSDPVAKYVPAAADAYIIKDGKKVTVGDKMTIEHLFTMSSGLSYMVNDEVRELLKRKNNAASTEEVVNEMFRAPLCFEPGERFMYGFSHDVLGLVIEKASCRPFAEFVKRTVFEPIDMFDSGFHDTLDTLDVLGQYKYVDGSLTAVGSENTMSLGKYYESGGAGLISTVEDYIKFADMLASGGIGYNGYRILKEDTVNIMRSGRMKYLRINNSFTCIQGGDYDYGCGVRVRTKSTEWGLPKGEFGWDGAAGSYVMVDPVNRISVVIGMNLLLWTDVFMGKHLEIVKAVYDEIV